MENLDYLTVMENRIQYFSKKYDPYSRYICDNLKQQQKIMKREAKKPPQRRVYKTVNETLKQVIAMFL